MTFAVFGLLGNFRLASFRTVEFTRSSNLTNLFRIWLIIILNWCREGSEKKSDFQRNFGQFVYSQIIRLFPHRLRFTALFAETLGSIVLRALNVPPPPPISMFSTTNLFTLCGRFSLLLSAVSFFAVVLWLQEIAPILSNFTIPSTFLMFFAVCYLLPGVPSFI